MKIINIAYKIAKSLISYKKKDYEYIYDPEHKKQPNGSGWVKTNKGWSKGIGNPEKETTPTWLKPGLAPNGEPSNLTPFQWNQTRSENFIKWADGNVIQDENGDPAVLYHGSTQTFDTFDINKAYGESYWGKGFYFTNQKHDANDNYHGGGADYESKLTSMTEKLIYDYDNGDLNPNDPEFKDYVKDGVLELEPWDAEKIIEKRLMGTPKLYSCYVKMEKPCKVTDNPFDKYVNKEDYIEDGVFDEDGYLADNNYYKEDEIESDWYEIRSKLIDDFDEKAINQIKDYFIESISDEDTLDNFKEKLDDAYLENNNGELATTIVIQAILKQMGYDGIIDNKVSKRFSNMHLSDDTTHYIAFNSNQIKSAEENNGNFSKDTDNINAEKE